MSVRFGKGQLVVMIFYAQSLEQKTNTTLFRTNIENALFQYISDVEGAAKVPTGYLEGIYVDTAFRNFGIAKRFIQLGEQWLKTKNCNQIGSDTWLTNKKARAFHKKMGFWEEDELVQFLKEIV